MTTSIPAPTAPVRDLTIPERTRIHGPITRRTLRRTLGLFLVLWAAGLTPVLLDAAPALQAAGLSLLVPAGGFLYTSDPVFVVLALLAVPAVAFRAQYRGDVVTPVAYWVVAAVGAALRSGTGTWDWARLFVPLTLLVLIAGVRIGRRVTFILDTRRGQRRNEVLERATVHQPGIDDPTVLESSPEDLAMLNGFLNLGLQPDDQWEGWDWGNQYSMQAMRYQLSWAQYSVSLANYTRTPAFTGYLAQAQRNWLTRMTDRRVWAYWRHENLFGNLDRNPDPIRRENIMYSGYWAAALGSYASTTGDLSLADPGALSLREDDDTVFAYDHASIIDAMLKNIDNPWGLFPCEPTLNFPVCNTLCLLGIQAWDRRAGTNHLERLLPAFRRSLDEEFTTADGEIIPIISNRFGYSWRFLGGVMAVAGTAFYLRALAPDVTARLWELLRHEHLLDGVPTSFGWTATDFGTNKKSPVVPYAFLAALAQEMGDVEIWERLMGALEEQCDGSTEDGVYWYRGVSTISNLMAGMARFGRRDGWYDLYARGNPAAWDAGPRLAEAAYPDVLVARAVTDGEALEVVLRPGDGGGRQPLVIERMRPHGRYQLSSTGGGDEFIEADGAGRAHVHVAVEERAEVLLRPLA